jgi:excisionase family DNA binding protein
MPGEGRPNMEVPLQQQNSAPPQPFEPLLLSRKQASTMLGVSPRTLDYLISNKELTVRRIGKRVLIPLVELRRFSRGDHQTRPN